MVPEGKAPERRKSATTKGGWTERRKINFRCSGRDCNLSIAKVSASAMLVSEKPGTFLGSNLSYLIPLTTKSIQSLLVSLSRINIKVSLYSSY